MKYTCCSPPAAQVDFHGELTTGNLHLVESVSTQGLANVLGLKKIDDIVSTPFKELKAKQQVNFILYMLHRMPALYYLSTLGAHTVPVKIQSVDEHLKGHQ